jgi:hypothetical protein
MLTTRRRTTPQPMTKRRETPSPMAMRRRKRMEMISGHGRR